MICQALSLAEQYPLFFLNIKGFGRPNPRLATADAGDRGLCFACWLWGFPRPMGNSPRPSSAVFCVFVSPVFFVGVLVLAHPQKT